MEQPQNLPENIDRFSLMVGLLIERLGLLAEYLKDDSGVLNIIASGTVFSLKGLPSINKITEVHDLFKNNEPPTEALRSNWEKARHSTHVYLLALGDVQRYLGKMLK